MEAIKKYIGAGLSIFPVNQDKSPACAEWRDVCYPVEAFNGFVGMECGSPSGGIECLDFDNHFGDAKQIISSFIKKVKGIYGRYDFVIESTQNGGYHFIYKAGNIEGNQKLASRPKQNGDKFVPDTLIETRGNGGYIVVAPTPGYKVIRGDMLNIPIITPDERDILISVARSFNEWHTKVRTEYEGSERPGDYYNSHPDSREEMIAALRNHGWIQRGAYMWVRPDKDKGVSATLDKVAKNIFYNFSSNGYPFEPSRAYTAFQVVGLLEYDGDFRRFASVIKERFMLNKPNDYYKKLPVREESKSNKDFLRMLKECMIDMDVPVSKPPVIMEINHGDYHYPVWRRLFTLGNFSVIIGKAKSKKTWLLKKIIATLGANNTDEGYIFRGSIPSGKEAILHFDTEESYYDAWSDAYVIHSINGRLDNVGTFTLRGKRHSERFKIIEMAIEHFKNSLSVVVIDGIADLVPSVNDDTFSQEILHKFMKWTEEYGIHIIGVLHMNKTNDYATGWLGTQIMKKAEVIIEVREDEDNEDYSTVSCGMIRGVKKFSKFSFSVVDGLPVIKRSL